MMVKSNIFKIKYSRYWVFLVAITAVVLDQISKIIVRDNLQLYEKIPLIKGLFNITHTENTGAAFSLFADNVEILTVISILATVVITAYVLLNKINFTLIEIIAWGFLLGGTNGNLIDRLFRHKVTDFLDFELINFPIFNFADMFIDIGAFLIILLCFIGPKNDKSNDK